MRWQHSARWLCCQRGYGAEQLLWVLPYFQDSLCPGRVQGEEKQPGCLCALLVTLLLCQTPGWLEDY